MEIIPKSTKAKKVFSGLNLLLYFSIVVFLILIASYFVFGYFSRKLEITAGNLREDLEQKKTSAEITMKQEILTAQRKIDLFSLLIKNQPSAANFFDFLETTLHLKVWFTEIDLNIGINQAVVFGRADNFFALGQQLMIFREERLIKGVRLSMFEIDKEGWVNFKVELSFHPQVFRR